MKIIVVNDFGYVNGGVGQVALASASSLARRGHSVTLVCAVLPVDESLQHPNLSVIYTGQHDVAHDPSRLRATVQGLWNMKSRQAMRKALQASPPGETVVHLHGWTKALSSSVIREASVAGLTIVATLHDYFTACPNGGFYNYPQQKVCDVPAMSAACICTNCDARNYPQKVWRVVRQSVQKTIAGYPGCVDHFISVSEMSLARLRPYLSEDAKVSYISNPVLVQKDVCADVRNNTAFTYIGRLSPEKGCLLFANAARAIGEKPVYVGEGSERGRITAACPDAVVTGWLPASGVKRELYKARALVLPSICEETQGLVVCEAAAAGVPAIVPDTCAARDLVANGETGLWFKGGDADDLAHKMQRLRDPNVAASMGSAAYERYWRDPRTLEKHTEALERVYRMALRRVSSSSAEGAHAA